MNPKLQPYLWPFDHQRTSPQWNKTPLVFGALPGKEWTKEVIGGSSATVFGGASISNINPYGPCGRTVSNSADGVWYTRAATMERLLVNKFSIAVYADVSSLAAYSFLLSIPYDTTWGGPNYSIIGLLKEDTTSIGRLHYHSGGSLRVVTGASGFLNASDGPTLYGVTRDGTSVKFYRNGVLQSSVTGGVAGNITFSTVNRVVFFNRHSGEPGEGIIGDAMMGAIWADVLTASQWLELAADPFAPFREYKKRVFLSVGGGGSTFFQNVGGTITVSGTLINSIKHSLSATISPAGTLGVGAALFQSVGDSVISISGALVDKIKHSLSSSISLSGELVNKTKHLLTSTITLTGLLNAGQKFTQSLSATITSFTSTLSTFYDEEGGGIDSGKRGHSIFGAISKSVRKGKRRKRR